MKTIGITGADGLIGTHLRVFLHGKSNYNVITANRQTFLDNTKLADFIAKCDAVVHLAGMNRGNENDIYETNVSLAERIVEACIGEKCTPHLVFSSSTHIYRDTTYGASKRKCTEIFVDWANKSRASFTNLILPHVFGEGGKPFYNSVVSTFCYQMANGENPKMVQDGKLELLHAQTAAKFILNVILSANGGDIIVPSTPLSVSALLNLLATIKKSYDMAIIPNLEDELHLALFNTYRSYLFPKQYPISLVLHQDNRGSLFEAVKSNNGGQCFISTTKPGITRGNHYHLHKVERFLVISGQAIIRVRKLFTNEVTEFRVSGEKLQYVDIPTLSTHNITNVGKDDLLTLFWSHEIFDPNCSDTYPEIV